MRWVAMDDLVAFLNARYDEREKAARKAASLCGYHPPAPSWTFGDESTDGRIVVVGDPHPDIRRKLSRRWNGSYDGLFAAEHIALNDPAFVLAEVEANRREVEMLAEVLASAALPEHVRDGRDPDEAEADERLAALADHLLRLRGLPFVDHPNYEESWRP